MSVLPTGGRIRGWLWRYLPAEMVCLATALLAAWAAHSLAGSVAVVAAAGTWGENVGFYGVMLGREVTRRGLQALPAIVRDLFVEFGPAEALDSLLLRPALMYAGVRLAPQPMLGIVAGKLVADLLFYTIAIISYELLQRSRRPSPMAEELPLVVSGAD